MGTVCFGGLNRSSHNHNLYVTFNNEPFIYFKFQIADLQYEDSESEESSEEEYDQDDPLAVLYSYVRHYKSGILAEPFLQLPSKREHPDYYLTIGDPISLNEVC